MTLRSRLLALAAVAASGLASDLITSMPPSADLPLPTASGGVQMLPPTINALLTGIGLDGKPTAAQPSFATLFGSTARHQLPVSTGHGQVAPGPTTCSAIGATDCSGALVAATGGTAALTKPQRAAFSFNVTNYGAKCDGTTDDAPAFNAALAAIRAQSTVSGTGGFELGRAGRLTAPKGQCLLKSTVNMTGLYGSGFVADLWGTTLLGQTGGTPVVDATGLGQGNILGLAVYGAATDSPSIGLVLGRITNDGVGADHNYVDHPTISGYFTLAPFYNNQSETTLVNFGSFTNWQPNAFGAIWDGSNIFNVQSAFTGQTYPQNTFQSFNENICIGCLIGTFGANSVPLYIGRSARHKLTNAYVFYSSSTANAPSPGAVLDFSNGGGPDFLDLDSHFEDFAGKSNMTSLVQFKGAANPVLHGLRMVDNYPEQSGPLFSRAPGVNSVGLQNADLNFGTLAGQSPSWWDLASAWTVSGRIYSQDGTYTAPGGMTGTVCVGATCTNTIVLPSNLKASRISNPGGVASLTLGGANNYGYGISVPTATIGPPPLGGQQALATVGYLSVNGYGYVDGTHGSRIGSGYAVNDVLTVPGGTSAGPDATAMQLKVTSVNGQGGITGWSGLNSTTATYSTTPPEPATLTGGTGSGAVLAGSSWRVTDVAITLLPGTGYLSAPAVTFGKGTCPSGATCGPSYPATATAALSSTFTSSAGNGALVEDDAGAGLQSSGVMLVQAAATGALLGSMGPSGKPAIAQGALVRSATASSTPATGATVAAAANTDSYGVLGSMTLVSLTFRLPALTGAVGQDFTIDFVPAVTTLTVQTASGGVVASTSAGATAPKRFKSFDGANWTMVQ